MGAGGVTSYKVVKPWEVVALQEVVGGRSWRRDRGWSSFFKLLGNPQLKDSANLMIGVVKQWAPCLFSMF